MKKLFASMLAAIAASCAAFADEPVEITVQLRLDEHSYVTGERVRGVIDVRNLSPDKISTGYSNSKDSLFIEVFRDGGSVQLDRTSKKPQTARFVLESNQGQKLETFLGDGYDLTIPGRYLARPVVVHGGHRFEGAYASFDIVPGMAISSALQMFSNRKGLSREFSLLHWSRKGTEHLFVTATDKGASSKKWVTTDIGPLMRITKPSISILPSGEVVVIHRNGPDSYVRSLFWSLPDALEFRSREMILDPETAGQRRMQEMMDASGGVQAEERPWWKFW
ncbi:MAG: hypothetical protein IIT98_05475 [Kiritimatiellae bacterium]|nr:hypothetical protein [Kiritimatiellia bacterium]